MGWIITTILLLVIAAVLLRIGKIITRQATSAVEDTQVSLRPAAFAVIGVWLLITALSSISQIDAGKIGLVKTFGEFTGQQSPGLNLKAPYQSVTDVDGRVLRRSVDMSGGDKGSAVSKETQPVYAKLEINYQLQLGEARKLYSSVGKSYYSRIIEPRVQQAFKAETVKYKTIDIAPNRERIRTEVADTLNAQLKQYGINVVTLTIRDLDFGTKFMDAIEDKQAATEQAKAAEAKVAIAKAEADSKVATARGDADAIAIKGRALAQNPKSIEQLAIEKLNPNVQIMVVPQNSPLLQLPQFKPAG